LLGSGPMVIEPMRWNEDFIHNYTWINNRYYTKYKIVDLNETRDVKVPWDLSRCQHFLILAEAFRITKDIQYAEKILIQIEHWLDNNPYLYSVNWTSAMDVAIRASNWICSIGLICNHININNKLAARIFKSLHEHGAYIYNNLEKYFPYSGNHYASNIAGLILISTIFLDTKNGKTWFNFAKQELFQEIRTQVLSSGVHFEKSIGYHRLVTEFFLYSILHLKKIGEEIPGDIDERLKNMLLFILAYTKKDNSTPSIGDQDDGRFLPFSLCRINDHTYLLGLGYHIYKDVRFEQYKSFGKLERLFFGLKEVSSNDCIQLSEKLVLNFCDAGYAFIKDNSFYLAFTNLGPDKFSDSKSIGKTSSHIHSDLLSFELTFNNTHFIVDPGSYVYTSNPKERNEFRSTAMHNTVCIDKENHHIYSSKNLFKVVNIGLPSKIVDLSNNNTIRLQSEHYAYNRLTDKVIHKRKIEYSRSTKTLLLTDFLLGKNKHLAQWFFHFGYELTVELVNKNSVSVSDKNNEMIIKFDLDKISLFVEHSYISPSYGIKLPSKKLIAEYNGNFPVRLKTIITFNNRDQ